MGVVCQKYSAGSYTLDMAKAKQAANSWPSGPVITVYALPGPGHPGFDGETIDAHYCAMGRCVRRSCCASDIDHVKFCCARCYETDGRQHTDACNESWPELRRMAVLGP